MYTTEIQQLIESTSLRLEEAQRADLERERLRLERFATLLKYVDEAHGQLVEHLNSNFTAVRAEIEALMNEQRAHAEKMTPEQGEL